MRCFVAWNPSPREAGSLVSVRDAVRAERDAPGYRWLAREQLHVTLRFLGATTDVQRVALEQALGELASRSTALSAQVAGWQYWPDRRTPRVLVLRIESRGALEQLATQIELAARLAGFAPEPRAFRAHLTLARMSYLERLPDAFTAPPPPVALALDHLALMRSDPGPDGSIYSELARFPLAAA
ncbi:MAG TPA: RNA 2',3'-cyclic phosphodiesterase [Candidatus Saccharimonadia bacterium]|nr:RNA 2',3'-cyclic phosphodiesterase [Candidatus Saccharimonadia bacterium]